MSARLKLVEKRISKTRPNLFLKNQHQNIGNLRYRMPLAKSKYI